MKVLAEIENGQKIGNIPSFAIQPKLDPNGGLIENENGLAIRGVEITQPHLTGNTFNGKPEYQMTKVFDLYENFPDGWVTIGDMGLTQIYVHEENVVYYQNDSNTLNGNCFTEDGTTGIWTVLRTGNNTNVYFKASQQSIKPNNDSKLFVTIKFTYR